MVAPVIGPPSVAASRPGVATTRFADRLGAPAQAREPTPFDAGKAQSSPAHSARICSPEAARASAAARPSSPVSVTVEPAKPAGADAGVGVRAIREVQLAQARLEHILKLAESGRSFSPAELIALQAHAYRASHELELAGKVVEKGLSAVKQTLQTQI